MAHVTPFECLAKAARSALLSGPDHDAVKTSIQHVAGELQELAKLRQQNAAEDASPPNELNSDQPLRAVSEDGEGREDAGE